MFGEWSLSFARGAIRLRLLCPRGGLDGNPVMLMLRLFHLPEIFVLLGALLALALTLSRARAANCAATEPGGRKGWGRGPLHRAPNSPPGSASTAEGMAPPTAEDLLRDFSASLLHLQDEERRRIARELHDTTAQTLGALAMNLERLQFLVRDSEAGTLITESKKLVEQVTAEVRTTSYLLHPPILDDLGLEYVLPWFTEGFSKRSGVSVQLKIQPALGRLPQEIELALFRIAQEALTNVYRHSGSRTVMVSLLQDARSVTLAVQDHGCGLPPGVLQSAQGRGGSLGVGIAGMQERVRQLGGHLTLSSNRGTCVQAVLPLNRVLVTVANDRLRPLENAAVAAAVRQQAGSGLAYEVAVAASSAGRADSSPRLQAAAGSSRRQNEGDKPLPQKGTQVPSGKPLKPVS